MVNTGAPTKLKNDDSCPFYYQSNSWSRQQKIPWNVEEKRAMQPGQHLGDLISTLMSFALCDIKQCVTTPVQVNGSTCKLK